MKVGNIILSKLNSNLGSIQGSPIFKNHKYLVLCLLISIGFHLFIGSLLSMGKSAFLKNSNPNPITEITLIETPAKDIKESITPEKKLSQPPNKKRSTEKAVPKKN
jgi:hypothetical protein